MATAAATAAKTSTSVNRAAYVSRLRRAFLLRAHPDRFRQRPPSVRKQQADLIQAISERFACLDFLEYTTSGHNGSSKKLNNGDHPLFAQDNNTYQYVLEKRDGSLLSQSISLNDNVQNVLQNLSNALKLSGTCPGFPSPPPPPPETASPSKILVAEEYFFGGGQSSNPSPAYQRMQTILRAASNTSPTTSINHQYDINTRKGTNLHHFFFQQQNEKQQQQHHQQFYSAASSINNRVDGYIDLDEEIKKRQSHRMDARAAALVARRAFGFASINGTNLGWSSESLAKCLLSLAELHEEHMEALKVDSFYPLSLVLSHGIKGLDGLNDNEEQQEREKNGNHGTFNVTHHRNNTESNRATIPPDLRIDLYGGIITLSPASTPLQWLQTLCNVTPSSLDILRTHRKNLEIYLDLIQNTWNVKLVRGHTCLPKEYYHFVMDLYHDIVAMNDINKEEGNTKEQDDPDKNALALERIKLIVESTSNTRKHLPRGKVTKQGDIRISTTMSIHQIQSTITNLSNDARQIKQKEEEKQQVCSKRMNILRDALGLRSVYKVKPSTVTSDQFLDCLDRLLLLLNVGGGGGACSSGYELNDDVLAKMEELKCRLAGQSLGITGSGHFCHLGDDGSILIPWDWHC